MNVLDKFTLYVFITCTLFIVNEQVVGDSFTSTVSSNSAETQTENVQQAGTQQPDELTETVRTSDTTNDIDKPQEQEIQNPGATEFFEKLFVESIKESRIHNSIIGIFENKKKNHNCNGMDDDRTWKQYYMCGNLHNNPETSPMFLSVGGFEGIDINKMETGPWFHLAKNFNAISCELENRYYGNSFPVEDLSITNLEYLKIEQQLADFVTYIDKGDYTERNWIVFGVGHGGTLAAMLRLMFPRRIIGAVIYNAPLLVTAENKKYYELFKNEFTENVKNNIKEAYKQMRAAITGDNYASYKNKFNMCDSLDSQSNKNTNTDFMFWSLTTYLVEVVKLKTTDVTTYNKIIEPLDHESIENLLDTFASAVQKILTAFNVICLDVDFKTAFEEYKCTQLEDGRKTYPKQLNLGLGFRQTHWQRCIEYGMFNTSDGEYTFGEKITLEFHAKMCKASFDIEFNSTVFDEMAKNTNRLFGGQNIGASQLIYISRGNEPNVGITESLSDDRISIHIEDGKQPDQLQNEYDFIIRKLKEWIKKAPEIKVPSEENPKNSDPEATGTIDVSTGGAEDLNRTLTG